MCKEVLQRITEASKNSLSSVDISRSELEMLALQNPDLLDVDTYILCSGIKLNVVRD